MKVLIGAEGPTMQDTVAKRFGHADSYLVVDESDGSVTPRENIDEGHNHNNLSVFVSEGVKAFIVGNIGPHAFEKVNKPGVSVYLARKMTAQEAYDAYKAGKLEKLTGPTAKKSIGDGHHHSH